MNAKIENSAKEAIKKLESSVRASLSKNAELIALHKGNMTDEGYNTALYIMDKLEYVYLHIAEMHKQEGMKFKK